MHRLIRKLHLYNPLICIYVLLRVQRAGQGITPRLALICKQPRWKLFSSRNGENQRIWGREPWRGPLLPCCIGPKSPGPLSATQHPSRCLPGPKESREYSQSSFQAKCSLWFPKQNWFYFSQHVLSKIKVPSTVRLSFFRSGSWHHKRKGEVV